MRKIVLFAAAMTLGGSSMASAQSNSCPGGGALSREQVTQDACQKAVDLFNYMAPQLGTIISGGNATLGQGGTLGGFPNFVVGLRVNALIGSLPEVTGSGVQPDFDGADSDAYTTKDQVLALPAVDAAIGIFKGLPIGVTNVGGVDLLLSAAYLPEYSGDGVDVVVPDGSLKIGYGARIGLLQESLVTPGLSVTILRRDLPTVNIDARANATTSLTVDELDLQTTAWRLTASKNLLVFGLAIGGGQDRYKSSAVVEATANALTSDRIALGQELTRTNYFADVYFNLLLAKVVAEIGMVQGGSVETFNTFDTPADDSRLYGSVGLRIGF
jgi:hypothetical protein